MSHGKMTEDQVMHALREAGLARGEMIVSRWKHGLDIDEPSWKAMTFAQAIIRGAALNDCGLESATPQPASPQQTKCPGCDGHECDNGCRYPGAVQAAPNGPEASDAAPTEGPCRICQAWIKNGHGHATTCTADDKAPSMAFVCPKCGTRGTTDGCSSSVAATNSEGTA